MSSDNAPDRIIAMATRYGAVWKVKPPSPWFGEEFRNVEYVRADLAPVLDEGLKERVRHHMNQYATCISTDEYTIDLLRDILEALEGK